MSRWQHLLWKWSAGLFAAVVILMATLAGIFNLIAPLVPGYRNDVQQFASQAIGYPVEIRSLGAGWGWLEPEISLENVRILTRDREHVTVQALEVRLGLSIWPLLHGQLPRPNRIVLVAPQLEIERDADGKFSIRGLEAAAKHSNTDWRRSLQDALSQSATLEVRNGTLGFYEAGQTQASIFQKLNLTLDNSSSSHSLSGDVLLPAAFGHSLEFESRATGQGLEPAQWDWQLRFHGKALALPRWLSYWPAYAERFQSGLVDADGEVGGGAGALKTASVNLTVHDLQPAPQAFPNAAAGGFSLLQANVSWSKTDAGWTLEGSSVQLQRGAQLWPQARFNLSFSDGGVQGQTWAGAASFLRLQDLAILAGWLPAQPQWDRSKLLHLAPSGDLSNVVFNSLWHDKDLGVWSVRAQFAELGIRATDGWPGFSGLSGKLAVNQGGGTLGLAAHNASVDFTPLFRGPLYASSVEADFKLMHDAQGWSINSDDLHVKNNDAEVTGHGGMQFPADGSAPRLDLEAAVRNADAHNKSAYFPVGIMAPDVVHWLDTAIVSGQVPEGSFVFHGKTSDFPFKHGEGVFDIKFHLQHGELDYAPGWPALKDLDADVRFLDQSLEAHARGGKFQGADITKATARFDDLATGVLVVDGTARGTAATSLDFLRTGPLKDTLAVFLDGLTATGGSDAAVHAVLPVTHISDFTLQGTDTLIDAAVTPGYAPGLVVSKINGDVDFDEHGVSARKVSGVLLGAPVSVSIRQGKGAERGATLFTALGGAQAKPLAAILKLPADDILQGQATWRLNGRIPGSATSASSPFVLNLTSDLTGMGVDLPAPFGKDSATSRPLRGTLTLPGRYAILVNLRYGDQVSGLLEFAQHPAGWQFDRGDAYLGPGKASLPELPGFVLEGELDEFVWDDWQRYITTGSGASTAAGSAAPGLISPALLRSVDLNIGSFSGFGQSIEDLQVSLNQTPDGWQMQLDSEAVAGKLTLPSKPDATHPLVVDMDRALLTAAPSAATSKAPAAQTVAAAPSAAPAKSSLDPRRVPAIHFSCKQLKYGGMSLQNLGADVVPQVDGVALKNLKIAASDSTLTGSGTWTVVSTGGQQSSLNVSIESQDVAKSLQSLGFAGGLTGDKGLIVANINWADSPFGDVADSLGGTIHVKLQNGQIVEVQPGAGRVFGLLSLNALPRRLLLNFSDVFSKGFGYDSIEGDFIVKDGDAYTNDLTIAGPAAKIYIIGRTGLAKRDFNEALLVDANVGSTLPWIGYFAGGPGAAAVGLVLSQLFKKPLTAVGRIQYNLTGTWDNPVMVKATNDQKPPSAPPQKSP